MQKLQRNVFYDSASAHASSDLNETVFLERVLCGAEGDDGRRLLRLQLLHPERARRRCAARLRLRSGAAQGADIHLGRVRICAGAAAATYLAIFKSYLPRELPGSNLLPFSVGYVRDVEAHPPKPIEERKLNVFFSGNLSPSRLPLYRTMHPVYRWLPVPATRVAFALEARGYCPWLLPRDLSWTWPSSALQLGAGFQQGLSRAEYSRCLTDSRIALCPMGARNTETFRHIEAMRGGAVVVSERLPDTHFYRGGADHHRRRLEGRPEAGGAAVEGRGRVEGSAARHAPLMGRRLQRGRDRALHARPIDRADRGGVGEPTSRMSLVGPVRRPDLCRAVGTVPP